jgi:hypothetical protein
MEEIMNMKKWASIGFVLVFLAPTMLACSPSNIQTAEQVTAPTATKAAATDTPAPTKEIIPTTRPVTRTPDIALTSTAEASSFASEINTLFANKIITSKDGQYTRLYDTDESLAKINWFQWHYFDENEHKNFVIRASADLETASNISNWADTGCGFVYHTSDNANYHTTFLAMDGYVRTYRNIKNIQTALKTGYYGKLNTPADSAMLMLAVDQQWVTFYVNDQQVVRFQDTTLKGGALGYVLHSGTNLDFGTRCKLTSVELWDLPN